MALVTFCVMMVLICSLKAAILTPTCTTSPPVAQNFRDFNGIYTVQLMSGTGVASVQCPYIEIAPTNLNPIAANNPSLPQGSYYYTATPTTTGTAHTNGYTWVQLKPKQAQVVSVSIEIDILGSLKTNAIVYSNANGIVIEDCGLLQSLTSSSVIPTVFVCTKDPDANSTVISGLVAPANLDPTKLVPVIQAGCPPKVSQANSAFSVL